MSLFILIYTAITHLHFKHYVAKWRYYSWLIIVLGLILPFRPEFNIALHENSKMAKLFHWKQGVPINMPEAVKSTEIINHKGTVVSWHFVLGVLWIAGFIAFVVYYMIKHRNFIKTVKRWSKEIDDPNTVRTLRNVQEKLKMSNDAKLFLCSCIDSPMMVCFFRPVILLPHIKYSYDDLSFIIKHELIHFKRKDLWYKSLVFLATAIYWFNPIVYLMAREISVQCELSCDEEVMKGASFDLRQKYSTMLISVMKSQLSVQSAFTTNFLGDKSNTKCRILSAMNMKKKKNGFITSSLLIIGAMATCITFTVRVETVEAKVIKEPSPNEYETISDYKKPVHNTINSVLAQNKSDSGNDLQSETEASEANSKYMLISETSTKDMLISKRNSKYMLVPEAGAKYMLLND